jgi:hypothetical protein
MSPDRPGTAKGSLITSLPTILHALSSSDQSPPSSPSLKPKLSAEEQKARREDRVLAIRLRMAIGQELDARGATTPAEIGAALGMPAQDATKLLTDINGAKSEAAGSASADVAASAAEP